MIYSAHDKLKSYMNSPSLNKIIIHREPIPELKSLNVGKELAVRLEGLIGDRNISFKAKQLMENLLKSAVYVDPEFGKVLSLTNLGILFEPELKIDFEYTLKKFSTDNLLFIEWKGEVEQNKLYLLTKEGIEIKLDNLSYITL